MQLSIEHQIKLVQDASPLYPYRLIHRLQRIPLFSFMLRSQMCISMKGAAQYLVRDWPVVRRGDC